MESRTGLLISIIDTAGLAITGLDHIDRIADQLVAGADVSLIRSQIRNISNEAREAIEYELDLAKSQLSKHI